MSSLAHAIPLLMPLAGILNSAADIERFPPPDFDSGHLLPPTTTPLPRAEWLGYLDVIVLLLALCLASYFALRVRNRKGIFVLTIFSLGYFGFFRKGCICSIGAIQNVTLALFDETYILPFTVTAFFLLPLVFSLFFGRVFCAGVCPLGAIQDLVLIKPMKVPEWLQHALGLLAYLYLGAAVLFAASGSGFIICQYDPFVAFFRLSGNVNIVVLGISLLVIGFFVGRPYCLFLCPYGVLLRHLSRLSQWRITVAPEGCFQCRLCENACPFGAIATPTSEEGHAPSGRDRTRLVAILMLAPFLIALSGWAFSLAGGPFSHTHFTVRLAEQIVLEDSGVLEGSTDASQTFRKTGQPKELLVRDAERLRRRFALGGWVLGGFMGLVIVCKLLALSVFRRRRAYDADRAGCLACGRCFSYCPPESEWREQNEQRASTQAEQAVSLK